MWFESGYFAEERDLNSKDTGNVSNMENENKTWLWVFIALGLLLISGGFGGYSMMGYGGMGFFGPVFMVLFWVAIIWLVLSLINIKKTEEDPMLTIKRRYSSGELSKKQYEEMKKELRH